MTLPYLVCLLRAYLTHALFERHLLNFLFQVGNSVLKHLGLFFVLLLDIVKLLVDFEQVLLKLPVHFFNHFLDRWVLVWKFVFRTFFINFGRTYWLIKLLTSTLVTSLPLRKLPHWIHHLY